MHPDHSMSRGPHQVVLPRGHLLLQMLIPAVPVSLQVPIVTWWLKAWLSVSSLSFRTHQMPKPG